MQDWFLYVVLAGMLGLMFMNSRKRKKQLAELKSSIVVGASVILHSGISGRIVSVDGDRMVIESTPGTKLTVLAGAVRGLDSWSAPAAAKPAAKAVAAKPVAKTAAKPAAKAGAKPATAVRKTAPKSTSK